MIEKTKKKKDCEFWTLLIPHSLDKKMLEHIEEYNYESVASFIRTAIYRQLDEEKSIDYPIPKPLHNLVGLQVPLDLQKEIDNSTAKTNYSSRSDFIRTAIRNQIGREQKNKLSDTRR